MFNDGTLCQASPSTGAQECATGSTQTQATSSQPSNPADKPKRPMNAFFLYRSHLHKHRLVDERHQSNFSVTAAQMWKSLSHAEKQRWYREAKRVKAEHLEKYPSLSLRWSPERKARAKAEREERARKRWNEALLGMKREEVEVAIFPHPVIAGDATDTDVLSEYGLSTASCSGTSRSSTEPTTPESSVFKCDSETLPSPMDSDHSCSMDSNTTTEFDFFALSSPQEDELMKRIAEYEFAVLHAMPGSSAEWGF